MAAVKAMVCITGIIFTGRMLLRPLMRRIAALQNADIFAATTLLVILGCSALTQMSGLSLALGAFLAGLLMAETEYALQVCSPGTLHCHHPPCLWHGWDHLDELSCSPFSLEQSFHGLVALCTCGASNNVSELWMETCMGPHPNSMLWVSLASPPLFNR